MQLSGVSHGRMGMRTHISCEAKSLVCKKKYKRMQLSGVSYGRMAMRSHISCEANNKARWSSG